jgi:hypothetical protein
MKHTSIYSERFSIDLECADIGNKEKKDILLEYRRVHEKIFG